MPLVCPRFIVLMSDPTEDNPDNTVEHTVTVLHGDQLRAELEGPKHRLPKLQDAPMHYSDLWIWAALVRTGVITDKFQEFKRRILASEGVDDDEPAGEGDEETGPTPPAEQ